MMEARFEVDLKSFCCCITNVSRFVIGDKQFPATSFLLEYSLLEGISTKGVQGFKRTLYYGAKSSCPECNDEEIQ